jgi:chemotaxis protein methyltransferase CheR
VLRRHGFASFGEYLAYLQQGEPTRLQELIAALTTTTSHFFREPEHFEALRRLLPEIAERKAKTPTPELRVWCSAASRGQEPYTLAMTISEAMAGAPPLPLRMLATDINPDCLAYAARGVYSSTEVAALPEWTRKKYFEPAPERCLRVKASLRELVRFAGFNLMCEAYPFRFPFDVIFCRNVLIYFEPETARAVVDKLARALGPGGYLFLGHCEVAMGRNELLKPMGTAIFQRRVE